MARIEGLVFESGAGLKGCVHGDGMKKCKGHFRILRGIQRLYLRLYHRKLFGGVRRSLHRPGLTGEIATALVALVDKERILLLYVRRIEKHRMAQVGGCRTGVDRTSKAILHEQRKIAGMVDMSV